MDNELLDLELCRNLRGIFNSTNIFYKDQKEKENFNFLCAIMDRFDSTASYINDNLNVPKSEAEFITYIAYCCIIKYGIDCLYSKLSLKNKKDSRFFKNIYTSNPLNIKEENYNDDKFFNYFRSLVLHIHLKQIGQYQITKKRIKNILKFNIHLVYW